MLNLVALPRGHLAVSRDILVVTTVVAAASNRGQGCCATCRGQDGPHREASSPQRTAGEIDKPLSWVLSQVLPEHLLHSQGCPQRENHCLLLDPRGTRGAGTGSSSLSGHTGSPRRSQDSNPTLSGSERWPRDPDSQRTVIGSHELQQSPWKHDLGSGVCRGRR